MIVRRLNLERQVIVVTMYGYPRDPKYCNAAAGYRSAYDAREGMFVRLPWDREPNAGPATAPGPPCDKRIGTNTAGASGEPAI